MRMWGIPPVYLCRNHLLGEHNELHMLAGCLRRGKKLTKYLDLKQISPKNLYIRHEVLVKELKRRSYKHASPLPEIEDQVYNFGPDLDLRNNLEDLRQRCPVCAQRLQGVDVL